MGDVMADTPVDSESLQFVMGKEGFKKEQVMERSVPIKKVITLELDLLMQGQIKEEDLQMCLERFINTQEVFLRGDHPYGEFYIRGGIVREIK
jgi:hypothetical protein